MPPLSTEVSPLLTRDVIESLAKQGIKTVAEFVRSEPVRLSRTTGLPYQLLTGIRRCLLAQFAPLPATAADIWRDLGDTTALLPTGCSNLDTLLGGGVMTGELTELTGAPASGKTQVPLNVLTILSLCQLCHSLATAGVLHSNSTVLWVDSTGGFSAGRLHSVLSSSSPFDEDNERLLERIQVHRLFNLFDLMSLLQTTSKRVSSQSDWFHANLHLLLIDSVTSLLSPLLGGHRGHGHALLSSLSAQLRSIAYEHSVAVVYTNSTVAGVGRTGGVKPALGQTWAYVPHTCLSLSLPSHPASHHQPPHPSPSHPQPSSTTTMEEPGERVAQLTKSSRLAVGVCTSYVITDRGIANSTSPSLNPT